jgi:hypothetical protein
MSIIRDVFNEYYVADTSKKIKAVKKAQAERGERVNGDAPYGYLINPENKHRLIIDPETAHVVKQIFSMYVQGARICHIHDWLVANEIPTVSELLYRRKGKCRHPRPKPDSMYNWPEKTIYDLLNRKEYIGHTVTAKTHRPSYKSSRTIINPEEKQHVFPNTHEPLIDSDMWELAQKRIATRTRPTKYDEIDLLSGLLYCADCKGKMYVVRRTAKYNRANAYSCSNFRNRPRQSGIACRSHYIRQALLTDLVLADLQRVLPYVREHEKEFISKATENGSTETRKMLDLKRRELDKVTSRMKDIDTIFRKLYADNALGKLSEQQFMSLTSGFDDEKSDLQKKSTELKTEINTIENRGIEVEKFVKIVKNYTDIQELTYENVHEFVDKIFIHEYDPESDNRKIEIHYSFVGKIDSGDEPTASVSYQRSVHKNVASIAI